MMIYDDLWWFVIQSIKIGMISPNHCGRGCGCRLASWLTGFNFWHSPHCRGCSFGIASCPGGYVFPSWEICSFSSFRFIGTIAYGWSEDKPIGADTMSCHFAGIQLPSVSTHMSMWRYYRLLTQGCGNLDRGTIWWLSYSQRYFFDHGIRMS